MRSQLSVGLTTGHMALEASMLNLRGADSVYLPSQDRGARFIRRQIRGTTSGPGRMPGFPRFPALPNTTFMEAKTGEMGGDKPVSANILSTRNSDNVSDGEWCFSASPTTGNRMAGAQYSVTQISPPTLNTLLGNADSGLVQQEAADITRIWRYSGLCGERDQLIPNRNIAAFARKISSSGMLTFPNIWLNQYSHSRMTPFMYLFFALLRVELPDPVDGVEKENSKWVCMPLASDTPAIPFHQLTTIAGGREWIGTYKMVGKMMKADRLSGNESITRCINDYLTGKAPFGSLDAIPTVTVMR